MKTVRSVLLLAAMAALLFTVSAGAAQDQKSDSQVDVPPVDVPETMIVPPTSKEIHDDFPERSCASCHSGSETDALQKPMNHFLTTRDCVACHLTQTFLPLRLYRHRSPKYKPEPGQSSQDCNLCHTSNSEFFAK
jgi:hypothetical protein